MIDNELVSHFYPGIGTSIYDGLTHMGYMIMSRAWENWYCKTLPGLNLALCTKFLQNWMDPAFHHLGVEVRKDAMKGRTVFATEDIPEGHFVNSQDAAFSWRIERDIWDALNKFVQDYPEAEMYCQV